MKYETTFSKEKTKYIEYTLRERERESILYIEPGIFTLFCECCLVLSSPAISMLYLDTWSFLCLSSPWLCRSRDQSSFSLVFLAGHWFKSYKTVSSKTFFIRFNGDQKQRVHPKSLQSCATLCDSVDCRPPRSSVHGIFWSGLPCAPPLGNLPDPRTEPTSLTSPLVGRFFTTSTTWEAWDFPESNVFPEKF